MLKNKEITKQPVFDSNFLSVIFFICSVMVIGIHSFNITDATYNTISAYIESFLCHGIFIAAVPIFFFVSGHLFFRNIESTADVIKKMKTRVKSVLMPFIAWSALYFAVFAVGSLTPFFSSANISFAPLDILRDIMFYRYCFPLWYMYQLVMFIILTPIIHKLIKKRFVGLGILICIAIFSVFVENSIDVNVFEDSSRSLFQFNFLGYYYAGCLSVQFSDYIVQIKSFIKNKRKIVLTVSFLLLVGFALLQSFIYEERISFFYDRFFVPVIAILIFVFLSCIYKRVPYIKNVSTMIVYGVHPVLGTVLGIVTSKIFSQIPLVISFLVSYALIAVISFAFAYILKKFLKPLHFIFSGGR